jgi:hypothetical protein
MTNDSGFPITTIGIYNGGGFYIIELKVKMWSRILVLHSESYI